MTHASPHRRQLTLAVLVLSLGLSACRTEPEEPPTAAVVGTIEIPAAEVERLLEQVEEGHDHGDGGSLEHRAALSFLIRLELLEDLARANGIDTTSDDTEAQAAEAIPFDDLAANGLTAQDLERGIRASRLTSQLAAHLFPDVSVSEGQIRGYYETHAEEFDASWVISGDIYFFDALAAAEQARSALQDGASRERIETDFQPIESGQLEGIESDAPLPDALKNVLAASEAGVPTEVVSDEPGATHTVVLVQDRRDVPARSLDEVREQIRSLLVAQTRRQLFWEWFEKQLLAASVNVDPYYGSWSAERGMVAP